MADSNITPVIIISWVFTLGGWGILIWNSNRIANRNETRSLCDRMVLYIQELRNVTHALWSDPIRSEAQVDLTISTSISLIELLDIVLSDCTNTKFIKTEKYSSMRLRFSDGYLDFMSSRDEKILCEKLRFIDEECNDAIHSIEDTYIDLYIKRGFINIAIHKFPNISLIIFLIFVFNLWYTVYLLITFYIK